MTLDVHTMVLLVMHHLILPHRVVPVIVIDVLHVIGVALLLAGVGLLFEILLVFEESSDRDHRLLLAGFLAVEFI